MGYRDTQKNVNKLKADFANFASSDEQRESANRRLLVVVKDMEDRIWPWRPNMDRSQSPPPCEERANRRRELETSRELDASGQDVGERKLWPSRGQVKAQGESPTKPTPPSSRPASAPFRRPVPSTTTDGKKLSSRPSSARDR